MNGTDSPRMTQQEPSDEWKRGFMAAKNMAIEQQQAQTRDLVTLLGVVTRAIGKDRGDGVFELRVSRAGFVKMKPGTAFERKDDELKDEMVFSVIPPRNELEVGP